MSTARTDFSTGVRDVLPLLPGFVTFGMIVGATAIEIGMSADEAIGMSLAMFGGAAQLAAIELLGRGAPGGVIVITALMINLRFSMFSASLAPYLRNMSTRWKWTSGYLLNTPSYVLSVAKFRTDEATSRRWYYLGSAIPVWITWQVSTVSGVLLGPAIPEGLQLGFVIPLVFMTLLFKVLDGPATGVSAITSGAIALVGSPLPLNFGLILAAVGGVGAGLLAERWEAVL